MPRFGCKTRRQRAIHVAGLDRHVSAQCRVGPSLRAYYDDLLAHFGPSGWWPGDTPFEVCVGAILTQNTAWANVEKAIANLKRLRMMSASTILAAPVDELEDALIPSGYFRVKSRRLRRFCEYLIDQHGGSVERMARTPIAVLRAQLLAVHGIGPETADDILLYACDKPVFVVDTYTRRVFARHGFVEPSVTYETLQEFLTSYLPEDLHLYKDYHAQIVNVGKEYCKPTPRCADCPLRHRLPPCGPVPL